jgi:hypothetical protein
MSTIFIGNLLLLSRALFGRTRATALNVEEARKAGTSTHVLSFVILKTACALPTVGTDEVGGSLLHFSWLKGK